MTGVTPGAPTGPRTSGPAPVESTGAAGVAGAAGAAGAADSTRISGRTTRTRSIWWSQLVLGASVVIITCVVAVEAPDRFLVWPMTLGVAGIMLLSALTVAAPWDRLPRGVVIIVPFADLLFIGGLATSTGVLLSFLWAFPVIWIATYASLGMLTWALSTISAILLAMVVVDPGPASILRLTTALVTIVFVGIVTHAASARGRAFRNLLRLQSARHRQTSLRVAADERAIVELTNAIDDGIARIDGAGRLSFVNDTYARMYGIDPSDLTQPPRSIDYQDSGAAPVPEDSRPLHRAARGEEFSDERVWLFDPEGRWRALSVSAKRLGAATGESGATMFLIARDVTDLLAAQREREQLAAMATHEMRHPLTAIVGNAELALDFDELTDKTRDRLEVIYQSSERLRELVTDFLDRSRHSDGEQDVVAAAFDLRTVLAASEQSFRVAAAAGEVAVESELLEALLVVADAFRLRQVIDNLLSNAIKYTGAGGRVFVSGRVREGRVVVTITDTGIGMSPTDLARVFDPYFRSEAAEGFAAGTGLGMGIARDLLALQGGMLTVDSRLRAGTTVTIDLPQAQGTTAPAATGRPEQERPR